jgi:hypothetical protein
MSNALGRAQTVVPRPDRVGKKYIASHLEEPFHRRVRVVSARLGWTVEAVLRFALFNTLPKLEKMAEEGDDPPS